MTTTLNIYTHVVDDSHRKAAEAVEQRLFDDVVPNGPKSADRLAEAKPVSDRIN